MSKNRVLRVALSFMLVALALVMGFSGCSGTTPVRVGEPAPDFKLDDLSGEAVSLSDFQGQPVVVNFWATWCPPCQGEMPYLQQIYDEWQGRGLVLLLVDIGESASRVRGFLQDNNLSLPVLLDSNKSVAQRYNIAAIPTTIFIGRDGKISDLVRGAFPDVEAIETYLDKIIGSE